MNTTTTTRFVLGTTANPGGEDTQLYVSAAMSRFESVLLEEGKSTDDGRMVEHGAVSFNRFDGQKGLPLMLNLASSHDGAQLAGTIDTLVRKGAQIYASGPFAPTPAGEKLRELIKEEAAIAPSVDLADTKGFLKLENGIQSESITSGLLIGATILPMQAQSGTWIKEAGAEQPSEEAPEEVLVASGAPPRDWFENPMLPQPTPLTITADGRVFGHAFLHDSCHIGHMDTCLTPPKSKSNYAYFCTGAVETDKGTVPVGQITLSGGHAGLNLSHQQAAAHYDDTKSAVADVAVGDDEFGGWVAGALRPNVSEDQINALRASALSGDWRRIAGSLEMVALLAVNTPGFPVPRAEAFVASGEVEALVASVVPHGQLPLVSREAQWDGSQAENRVRKWASTDGSGINSTMDWAKYKQAFFWYNQNLADTIESYKLPFCDIIDGKLTAVPRGIFAVAASLGGARAGVDIPEADKASIRGQIEGFYARINQADKSGAAPVVAPWTPGGSGQASIERVQKFRRANKVQLAKAKVG